MESNTPEAIMHRAIRLARKGAGFVQSNPLVGSVLVHQSGKILAESFHDHWGGPHAEQKLLKNIKPPRSASLYVTLEPCCHTGKTPPCVDLIIASGIKHVVVGSIDPNPLMQGKSIRQLRRAGIKVEVGVAQTECDYLIRTFRKWITTNQPYVLGKVGMSLDAKITSGNQQRYITNQLALQRVHELRQEFSVIMVGVNTIIRDNPRLDTRLAKKKLHHPVKVILDSRLRTPPHSAALDDHTIIVCADSATMTHKRALARTGAEILEFPSDQQHGELILAELGRRGYSNVLLEGGSYVFTSFINLRAIDEFYLFMAPYLFGALRLPFTYALRHPVQLIDPVFEQLEDNILIRGYAQYK
ncbi:MAG: bifunctional diaminohydroxyphosphoribosylaminopyrimidine deaminase/5-amino-6-(5-phosphoribosylamino)uracil reductase RibD [Patescibacteria group bacterium]|jgi:diaminohydroxyphosphoribosylaminopyrimidine deaminase/5-amino-6-(5-phosphoribosylamino)uracil reductase